MSISRIADSVFLEIAIDKKKKNYKTDINSPVEESFFEALQHNQYGTRENEQQKQKKKEDKDAHMNAWKMAQQDNSHWFVDENVGTHINTAG